MALRVGKRKLRRISRWLASFPSLGYALVYLFCIPSFATIYYFLPYHFYHSTIQYEQVLDKDADNILKEIRSEIIKTFKEEHGAEVIVSDGWTVDINELGIGSLKAKGDVVSFSMYVDFSKNPKEIRSADGSAHAITRDVKPQIGEINIYLNDYKGAETIFIDKDKWPGITNLHLLFPYEEKIGNITVDSRALPFDFFNNDSAFPNNFESALMPISNSLHEKIIGYAKGVSGFPSKTTGSYWRMLYLSAVTISTLGYGDILPITTTSRILLSAESIMGIVLIGLFLNSLAYEANFKEDDLSQPKENISKNDEH
jgi:hypothetical protein